jgi:hypothetical protein
LSGTDDCTAARAAEPAADAAVISFSPQYWQVARLAALSWWQWEHLTVAESDSPHALHALSSSETAVPHFPQITGIDTSLTGLSRVAI